MKITAGQSTEMNLYGPDTQAGERGARVLHVVIHHHGSHIGLLFTDHAGLNRALPVSEARAYLTDVKREANAGTAVWAIEAKAGAWTSAAAIVDQADRDMVEGIRGNMEAAQPGRVDVSDIVDGPRGPSFTDLKRNDFTRTRVGCKPLTPAELDLVRSHRGGEVRVRPGQSWLTLRAIVRRGYGTAVYGVGHRIVAVNLNERGLAVAEQNGVAA